ncbi:hypothetical protein HK096_007392, partial [Nowakowskiella sp. JEL0078]
MSTKPAIKTQDYVAIEPSQPIEETPDSPDRKRSLEDESLSDEDGSETAAGRFKRQALTTDHTLPPVKESEHKSAPSKSETESDVVATAATLDLLKTLSMRALISTKEAGIVIGKSGKNVEDIRILSGAKVTVSDHIASAVERVLTLTGPLDTIAKAFSLVATKIVEEQQTTVDLKSRHTSIRILVPHARMGSVIGKAGTKIKEVQDASGAKVMASEELLPGSTERVVTVAGVIDSIHIATYHIGLVLQENLDRDRTAGTIHYRPIPGGVAIGASRSAPQPYMPYHSPGYYPPPQMRGIPQATIQQQIYIPNDMVGAIIGKQGAKINEIRSQSCCQIKISEPSPHSNDRLVTITGLPENNQMAMYLLYS